MKDVTPNRVPAAVIFLPVFLLILIFAAFSSYFTVSAGNVAVKLRFGKLVGAYGEGIHFKVPIIDTVEKFYDKFSRL